MRGFWLLATGLAACATTGGYLTEEPACKTGPREWYETDLTHVLLYAEQDSEGIWQFAAPVDWLSVDSVEGFWDPAAGEGAMTLHYADDATIEVSERRLTGTIERTGDHALSVERLTRYRSGGTTPASYRVSQQGCEGTFEGLDEYGEVANTTSHLWDRRGGTYTTAWPEGTFEGSETGSYTDDGVWENHRDRSYPDWIVRETRDETLDMALGEHEGTVAWELVNGETMDARFSWRYDGLMEESWRQEWPNGRFEDCEYSAKPDGSYTRTCATPERTCTQVSDGTACTETCDDGGGPWSC